MKKFELQSILDYRQQQKNIAQQKLYEVLAEKARLAAEIVRKEEELHRLAASLEKRQQGGMRQAELAIYENCRTFKGEELAALQTGMGALEKNIALRRQALCEAERQQKLLEKLKEKQILAYRDRLNRNETVRLDEIAGRFGTEGKFES